MRHQLDFEKPIAELQSKLGELKKHPETHALDISFEEEVALIEKKLEETKRQIFLNLSAWDRIKIARHPKRPFTLDYLTSAFAGFSELHGDRLFAEDRAVVGGFAWLGPHKVMAIGTQKAPCSQPSASPSPVLPSLTTSISIGVLTTSNNTWSISTVRSGTAIRNLPR